MSSFRLERVRIKLWDGQAKILGTLLCVGGAMLMTFYENPSQSQEGSHAQQLLYLDHFPLVQSLKFVGKSRGSFLFGALLTIIGSWSMSFFMIYQVLLWSLSLSLSVFNAIYAFFSKMYSQFRHLNDLFSSATRMVPIERVQQNNNQSLHQHHLCCISSMQQLVSSWSDLSR